MLTAEPGLSNDEVFARVKARGVTKPDVEIRDAISTARIAIGRNCGTIHAPDEPATW